MYIKQAFVHDQEKLEPKNIDREEEERWKQEQRTKGIENKEGKDGGYKRWKLVVSLHSREYEVTTLHLIVWDNCIVLRYTVA